MPLILEGLLTTVNADGGVNIAPLGPIVEPELRRFLLRPFQTSATYSNLVRGRRGVFHVTDDAELIALAAIDQLTEPPPLRPTPGGSGWIITTACRWYELQVESIDDSTGRAEMRAEVVASGTLRDFFGFNRGKHAIVEGAILATRLHLTPRAEVLAELVRLKIAIDKTGGAAEQRAWQALYEYVESYERIPPSA